MAIINCPQCGKKLMEQAQSCPRCGYTFLIAESQPAESTPVIPEEAEPARFDPAMIKAELYKMLIPAVEDIHKLSSVKKEMEANFDKFTTLVSPKAHMIAWDKLERALRRAIFSQESDDKFAKKQANEAAQRALNNFNTAINNMSTPGLGFSLITGSAAQAVAFSALNSFEAHCQEMSQTKNAYKNLLSDLQAISSASNGKTNMMLIRDIMIAINSTVDYLEDMYHTRVFVTEHQDFYTNPDEYDLGLTIAGVNIFDLLANASSRPGHPVSPTNYIGEVYQHDLAMRDALLEIRKAGYIKLAGKNNLYYSTTGKYEKEVLREILQYDHPEEYALSEKALAKQYAQAEKELAAGQFYQAAVHFAKLDGYRDAMRRSMSIWKEKLLSLSPVNLSYGYALKSDGSILATDELLQKFSEEDRHKLTSYTNLKQIYLGIDKYVALKGDGTIDTNIPEFCLDADDPKKHTAGNGSGWHNVSQMIVKPNYLAVLHKDGTVSAVGSNYKNQCNTSGWTNVKKLFHSYGTTLAGLKHDGTVVVTGELTEKTTEYSSWTDIVDLYICDYWIVGLKADGQVVSARGNWKPDIFSQWNNIARIHDVYAITWDGDVFYGGEKRSCGEDVRDLDAEDLHGIVHIGHSSAKSVIALKADGTVICKNLLLDVSAWTDVVALTDCSSYGCKAIRADGTVLIADEKPTETPVAEWKLFDHVNTIQEEYLQAKKERQRYLEQQIAIKSAELRNLKGLFTGKKRSALQDAIQTLQTELTALQE